MFSELPTHLRSFDMVSFLTQRRRGLAKFAEEELKSSRGPWGVYLLFNSLRALRNLCVSALKN
jgi:hypothetical protein